jgi:hypothetical protein
MVRIDQAAQDPSFPHAMDLQSLSFSLYQAAGDAGLLGCHDDETGPVLVEPLDGFGIQFEDIARIWWCERNGRRRR